MRDDGGIGRGIQRIADTAVVAEIAKLILNLLQGEVIVVKQPISNVSTNTESL